MSDGQYDELDYEAIRKRAEKRVASRIGFGIHLTVYIIVNLFLWMLYFLVDGSNDGSLWPLYPMFFWGIAVVMHGASVFFGGAIENLREREVEREIERERRKRGISSEKPKREERPVRISDEGELVTDRDDDEYENNQAAARSDRVRRSAK